MFLFRPHRELLVDAMAEVISLKDKAALVEHIKQSWVSFPNHGFIITEDTVKVEKYGYDERIGWDTYIVTVKNGDEEHVEGFTNGPV